MSRKKKDAPTRASKERVDALLVEQGLARTRSHAQSLVLSGRVFRGEERIEKSGVLLERETHFELRGGKQFVSRGGDKLDGAIASLGVEVMGLVCADIGASTGGFTDCLLQRGAARVHAVDVGYGLLAEALRNDARVHVLERTNARYLQVDMLGELVDCVVVDASFISIDKLLPAISSITKPDGSLLAMIKPQFEAGREEVSKGRGVIRDPEVREKTLRAAEAAIRTAGYVIVAGCDAPIPGPKGNLEYFVWAKKA